MSQSEQLTIVFTDLVGSTELSSSLTPAAADQLRREHFADLREAIGANGGSEVKNLGDGVMVRFSSTSGALSCAVAMQQAVDRRSRHSEVELAIRVGISAGDVTVEEGDCFGDVVIEAARLCAAAQGGEILAADVVRALARRSGHAFTTERELELKGLPEPVVAWGVQWEPILDGTGGGARPLPIRLPAVPITGLVGRTQNLERLHAEWKAVAAEERAALLLVSGEAGIGKSTLTGTFCREIHRDGALVLYGRCDEDRAVPYGPFVEALSQVLLHLPDDALARLGSERLAALGRLVPAIVRRSEVEINLGTDLDAERWLLYGAVIALLETASTEAPLALLLDDLHWADVPTLQLLRQLAASATGRVFVIGTYRGNELGAGHALVETLAALAREPHVVRMTLGGLDDVGVISFMEAAAGQEMDDAGLELAHALSRETGGNPFFVGEVLRHLVETRSIVQDDRGRWVPTRSLADVGLPEGVRQVIGTRVARLGSQATSVLAAASVVGQEFDVDLVAEVAGVDEDNALDVLDDAAAAALVTEVHGVPGRFRFAHALVQHTLYDDVGPGRRARLHRAAAAALETRVGTHPGARAAELARHCLAAVRTADTVRAVGYARLAGEQALSVLAPDEAARWFGEALTVLVQVPDDVEHARCLAGLGEAQRQMSLPGYRETLLGAVERARSVGDVDTMVRAALANYRGFSSAIGQIDQERVDAMRACLEALPPQDSIRRARLLAQLASELTWGGSFAERKLLADEALTLADRSGDAPTRLAVRQVRWQAIWSPETLPQLYAESLEAAELANRLGDPVARYWSVLRALWAFQLGDVTHLEEWFDEARRLAVEIGQPVLRWNITFHSSWVALLFGDVTGAEALAEEALHLGSEAGEADVLLVYAAELGQIRWHQGRLDEVVDLILDLARKNPGVPGYSSFAAHALAETGRWEEARHLLEAALAKGFPSEVDQNMAVTLAQWAHAASGLRHREAAEVLLPKMESWAGIVIHSGCTVLGAGAHEAATLASVLGRYDEADAYFARALGLHETIRSPFSISETQLEWSRMLLERAAPGDVDRATEMLDQVSATATRLGYLGLRAKAVALGSHLA